MGGRASGDAAKKLRYTAPDVVIAAVAVALLGYVASTTLRPVLHNAAATNAAFQGDLAAAERHLVAAAVQARRFGSRGSLATALERLADLRWQTGRWLESEEPLEQLLALREQSLGSRLPLVADVLERLVLVAQHRHE